VDHFPPAAYKLVLKATPGQLLFGRDFALPIHFVADWEEIEQPFQKEMAHNNNRESASRKNHDYKVGVKLLLKKLGKHLRK
jgi:hypothetical protein